MYIVSIVDTFPNGKDYAPVPKLTKVESVNYLREVLRAIYKETNDLDKKNLTNQLIQRTNNGRASDWRERDGNQIAYDICDFKEWDYKQQALISHLQTEIGGLNEFIRKNKEAIKQLKG